jgi:hypothetical protein
VKRIAEQAQVASDTLYAIFGSKSRVLTALIDLRLTDSTEIASELELPEALAIRDEQDQRRQISLYVRFAIHGLERVGRVYAIMRSAAAVDSEMKSILLEMQSYRAQHAKTIAGWIAKNGPLRVKKERAGEIMWALLSHELAGMLREEQGWHTEEYAEWLEDTLAFALLPTPTRTARKSR